MTNVQLRLLTVNSARSFLNVKFEHQGRTHLGVDCIGLIVRSLVDAGYKPESPETFYKNDYNRVPSSKGLLECVGAEASLIYSGSETAQWAAENALPVDLIVMAYRPDTRPRHLAMVTGGEGRNVRIIHTNSEFGMVKEHLLFPTYAMYSVAAYRLKTLCEA